MIYSRHPCNVYTDGCIRVKHLLERPVRIVLTFTVSFVLKKVTYKNRTRYTVYGYYTPNAYPSTFRNVYIVRRNILPVKLNPPTYPYTKNNTKNNPCRPVSNIHLPRRSSGVIRRIQVTIPYLSRRTHLRVILPTPIT